jgi:hypothetical protein
MTYPPQPPQQPYGYGQQSQQPYPQQQPYGYGPPQGYGPPPKKSKTGLIVGIVIGVVVVLGGGATALFLLLGGSSGPSGDPSSTAQKYVDAVNARDGAAVRGLACTPMSESDSKAAGAKFAATDLKLTLAGPSGTASESEAYFWLDSTSAASPAKQRLMLPVRADGSRWCVSVGALGMPS